MKDDSGKGMTWQEALEYAENYSYGGYDDWRLPSVKELQSIVDYDRSPSFTSSAAISPLFNCTQITNEAGQKIILPIGAQPPISDMLRIGLESMHAMYVLEEQWNIWADG